MNIVQMSDAYLAEHGDRVRATDHTGDWTGARLGERARRLAAGLAAHGVGQGDRVGVMMANAVDVFVAYEAVWRAGAAITPLMPALVEDEVAHVLGSAEPAAVIADGPSAAVVRAARRRTGGRFPLVGGAEGGDLGPAAGEPAAEGDDEGVGDGDVGLAELEATPEARPAPVADDDLAALLFTGGTTGRAKGVMLTHHNLVTTAHLAARSDPSGPEDLSLVTLPLSHGFGLVVFLVTFLRPARLLVHRRFDPAVFAATVEKEGVTVTDAVPAMLRALLDAGHVHSGALRSLRRVYVGGSYCPSDLIEAVEAGTGARVLEGYGLTESGALIAGDVPSRPHRRGSVGLPYDGVEVRVVDPGGADVPRGEIGEVIARSEAMMTGYWRDDAATAEAIRDGWLYTGDLGSQDEDGYLRIVGRRKDLIIRGGFNIHPTDLENVIRRCEGVSEVCVFGIPDRALGELVVAAVAGTCSPRDVESHCRVSVAPHKRPDRVVIVGELPRTPVGKPDRRALAAGSWGEQARENTWIGEGE